jgi:hypothetical protein
MAIDFKGMHYPESVILHAVFFYVRYAVSYRDLEEILAERGVTVDHATLNGWVVKHAPLIAARAQLRGCGIRDPRMGRLVQQPPPARAHREHPARRSRDQLLRSSGN